MSDEQHYRYMSGSMRPVSLPTTARIFAVPHWMRWLRRPLRRIWERFSVQHFDTVHEFKTHAVTSDSVLLLVQKCKIDIRRVWNSEGAWLICGPKQLNQLDHESCAMLGPMEFDFSMPYARGEIRRDTNLKVLMVPWFDDVVVVPFDLVDTECRRKATY